MLPEVNVPLAVATLTAAFAGLAFSGAVITSAYELMKGLIQSLQHLVDIGLGGLITLLIGNSRSSA
ncbi:hypothetical protein JQ616_17735 [Bradyrhizobium tropiciagri]|uniref:hypothetical protein n=1 Tax=Bradyrhizobium tropiciagri TaxID=312253 RepID=UPI001BABE85B|nr:hypothetical protein [Bradyrhizobium tropiciagri]MBR0896805.1 hypothetical protein [Bradyrhizobium tropiciagri]